MSLNRPQCNPPAYALARVQSGSSRRRRSHHVARIAVYALLILGTLVTLVPFIWILATSFKPASEIVRMPPTFFPENWTFNSYQTIFNDSKIPLARFYLNSALVAFGRVIITLFVSSLVGYVFAKYNFRGKNLLFGFILIQLMVPFTVIMIPSYLILVQLR